MVCHRTGKPAQTEFRVLERLASTTLVCLMPRTGRSHQLRVHLASLGHPILGDNLYGSDRTDVPIARLHLHASQLGLFHPYSGDWVQFFAPCEFAPHISLPTLHPPDPDGHVTPKQGREYDFAP
jgi:tRNA pseudouridine32 synthase/23S rRNA pseudouridine746 synthase